MKGLAHQTSQVIIISCVRYSRTDDPDASKELLGVLGVDKLFDYMEIFPSQKFAHFRKYDFA